MEFSISFINEFIKLIRKTTISINEIENFITLMKRSSDNRFISKPNINLSKLNTIYFILNNILNSAYKKNLKSINFSIKDEFLLNEFEKSIILNTQLYNLEEIKSFSEKKNEMIIEYKFDNSVGTVYEILDNMIISSDSTYEEKELETDLVSYLERFYGKENVQRQYNIGGFLGLKTDIDLYNGLIGIELKLYNKLDSSGLQRLIGQVIYYTKRAYKDQFIVFISGDTNADAKLKEIQNFLKELNVLFLYKKAVNIGMKK